MGFLNLSAWRPIGGRRIAERRARAAFAQPPRYYYDNLGVFQAMIDRYFEENGRRPMDVAELFLWHLDREGKQEDEARALDLADLFSYYDIEPNSLLAMVSISQDHGAIARHLMEARRVRLTQGHRPPGPIPFRVGQA